MGFEKELIGLIDRYKFAVYILKRILRDENFNNYCKSKGILAEIILEDILKNQKNYDEDDWTAKRYSNFGWQEYIDKICKEKGRSEEDLILNFVTKGKNSETKKENLMPVNRTKKQPWEQEIDEEQMQEFIKKIKSLYSNT